MEVSKDPSPEQLKNLMELSLALGVSKKAAGDTLAPVKLAFHPFSTSKAVYAQLESISQVWQKLIFRASRNSELIDRVYEQIKNSDPMISQLMRIRGQRNCTNDEGVVICRCDYFMSETEDPKIIEYNLTSVSMTSHAENFQKAKRLSDLKNSCKYIKNEPNQRFAAEIIELYTRKQLNGCFLMIVSANESNIIEQRLLEIQLLKNGIQVIRLTLSEVIGKLQLDKQGNLKHNDEVVSVAYYRAGYQTSDYEQDPATLWRARERIELSNAIKIPNVIFELMNQKRMQVELSKEAIYSQYISPEEAELFRKSLVPVWEFDHMTEEEFRLLIKQIEENGKEYVLKPNLEGGGNNIYGEEAKERLKQMSAEERKKYILMEKIVTKPIQNILINGPHHVKANCIYELSQYGIITIDSQELLKSDCCGFLIRIKPEDVNEGGIMAGVGSLCSWMIEDTE